MKNGGVYEGIELCRKENVDFILAVGGGSTIDSAKAIAAGTIYDGDFWDFYSGKYIEKVLPVGAILTIAAAGSEGGRHSEACQRIVPRRWPGRLYLGICDTY